MIDTSDMVVGDHAVRARERRYSLKTGFYRKVVFQGPTLIRCMSRKPRAKDRVDPNTVATRLFRGNQDNHCLFVRSFLPRHPCQRNQHIAEWHRGGRALALGKALTNACLDGASSLFARMKSISHADEIAVCPAPFQGWGANP
jgi:hypothetical protein